jgi:Carbohydrate/starch-binding module (family 21)
METSSPIPAVGLSPSANLHVESLTLSSAHAARNSALGSASSSLQQAPESLALTGTLLVRNIAYEKTVAVRYTLDDWHTTCEVAAWHVESLPTLPGRIFRAGSGLDASVSSLSDSESNSFSNSNGELSRAEAIPGWDRFAFAISLEGYAATLERRTMWLVARYVVPTPEGSLPTDVLALYPSVWVGGGGAGRVWWDNNMGKNYRVGFQVWEGEGGEKVHTRTRGKTASTPRKLSFSFILV